MKLFYLTLSLLLLTASTVCKAQDDDDDVEVEEDEEVIEEGVVDDYTSPEPSGPTYLYENFDEAGVLHTKWRKSSAKKEGVEEDIAKYDGEWAVEAAQENALSGDLGLVLKSKAKHHAISAKLDQPFKFEEDPFIVQYEVKFQNGLDCGGAYVKLLAGTPDLEEFHDKTRYSIMFGPDKCGADSKLHFIFQHKNPITGEFEEKHAKKPSGKFSQVFTDKKSHLFTLILDAENNFNILVDQVSVNSGNLLVDMTPPVNPPAEIEDPDDKKPEDWDDRKKIPDPDAIKPDDWDEDAPARIRDPDAEKPEGWLDDEPEFLDDPDAEKPDDWDDDMDGEWEPPKIPNPNCEEVGCGEWEPPMINNPEYKGKWRPPMIDNPQYSGQWSPRMIPNPEFFEDLEPFRMATIGAIGLELWSMSDSILFDNFIITSDKEVAKQWATDSWKIKAKKEGSAAGGDGIVQQFLNQTEERPWLWIVVGLVVVIPLVLLFRLCFRQSGSEEESQETAEGTEDQEGEEKEGEGEEPTEEAEEVEPEDKGEDEVDETVDGEGDNTGGVRQRKKSKKADLEQTTETPEEEESTEPEAKEGVRKSPRQKKTRKE